MAEVKVMKVSISLKHQYGATLIVALVILAVVTVLGIASMRSSNLELKMAASERDRSVAFQIAESGLMAVEKYLASPAGRFGIENFLSSCKGDRCFTPNCTNGLCFSGDIDNAKSKRDCQLANASGDVLEKWRVSGMWDPPANNTDPATYKTIDVPKTNDYSTTTNVNKVQYMIEFLCFVPRDENQPETFEDGSDAWDLPLYRITVRAEGEANRSTVMLQSIFKAGR